MKISRPWTGKKDSLPDDKKKTQHGDRKYKKVVLRELQEKDWEEQVKEFNADSTIQE